VTVLSEGLLRSSKISDFGNCLRTTKLLVDAGADVNYNRGKAFLQTIRKEELLVEFLKRKPSVSILSTALFHALKLDDPDKVSKTITLLLDAGADVNFE